MLYSILVAVDVLLAIGIIGLVLIQHGKGADVGAAFGSGASGTVFGSQGSASFLTRLTAILATCFFINSLVLAYLASNRTEIESVIDDAVQTTIEEPIMQNIPDEMDVPIVDQESELSVDDIPEIDEAAEMMDSVNESIQEMTSEDLPDDIPTEDLPN